MFHPFLRRIQRILLFSGLNGHPIDAAACFEPLLQDPRPDGWTSDLGALEQCTMYAFGSYVKHEVFQI